MGADIDEDHQHVRGRRRGAIVPRVGTNPVKRYRGKCASEPEELQHAGTVACTAGHEQSGSDSEQVGETGYRGTSHLRSDVYECDASQRGVSTDEPDSDGSDRPIGRLQQRHERRRCVTDDTHRDHLYRVAGKRAEDEHDGRRRCEFHRHSESPRRRRRMPQCRPKVGKEPDCSVPNTTTSFMVTQKV